MGWVRARYIYIYLALLILAILISGCIGPIVPGPPVGVPETGAPEPKITFETNFTVKDQLGREGLWDRIV